MKKRKAKKAPKKARPLTDRQRLTIARFKLRQLRKAFDVVTAQREGWRVEARDLTEKLTQTELLAHSLRNAAAQARADNGVEERAECDRLRLQLDAARGAYQDLLLAMARDADKPGAGVKLANPDCSGTCTRADFSKNLR